MFYILELKVIPFISHKNGMPGMGGRKRRLGKGGGEMVVIIPFWYYTNCTSAQFPPIALMYLFTLHHQKGSHQNKSYRPAVHLGGEKKFILVQNFATVSHKPRTSHTVQQFTSVVRRNSFWYKISQQYHINQE